MARPEVVIIGGGMAGLCCARRLNQEGISFLLLESSDSVGGRIRTDKIQGFLLDRGFQTLLTSYPEAQQILDYSSLQLNPFISGALVRLDGRFQKIIDPWRNLWAGVRQLTSPVGNLMDKLRIGKLRTKVLNNSLDKLLTEEESTTLSVLRSYGFSSSMIDHFFRPFLGGVFLEPDLRTSSRFLHILFRMFASGDAALPAGGMESIPRQVALNLPQQSIRVGAKVTKLESSGIVLDSGETLPADTVVIATEGPQAARLFNQVSRPVSRSVTCLYFAAKTPPIDEPILVLNGEGKGPINNLCVPSQVAPSYAPPGAALVSVTVLGKHKQQYEPLEDSVRAQMEEWFGSDARGWLHLKTYNILHALPALEPPTLPGLTRPSRVHTNLFICGDYTDTASINGAMISGRRAAEAVIQDLK